eukprot:3294113-Pleurochrysis_carterae.AAC.4
MDSRQASAEKAQLQGTMHKSSQKEGTVWIGGTSVAPGQSRAHVSGAAALRGSALAAAAPARMTARRGSKRR